MEKINAHYYRLLAQLGTAAAADFWNIVQRYYQLGGGRIPPQVVDRVAENIMSRPRVGDKRPRDRGPEPSRTIMRSYLPNPGIYRGRLVTGPLHKPGFSRVTKNGYVKEVQYSGEQHMEDCLYIGCSSYHESNLKDAFCVSIIREYFARFSPVRQEFESDASLLADIDANAKIQVLYTNPLQTPSTVVDQYNWTGGIPVLTAASDLATGFINRWLEGYKPVRLMQVYEYHDESAAPQVMVSGAMNLEDLIISCWSKTLMNIQATTKADDGSSYTTDITQNPLVGKLFYFKDKYPEVRPDSVVAGITSTADNWGSLYLTNSRLAHPYITPGQVAAPPVTAVSAQPTGSWRSVPIADMFRNVVSEGYVHLDPSNIKRCQIRFKFVGTIESWLKQFTRFDASEALGTNDGGKDYSFGTSMLCCLEKRVRTGANVVRVSVHFDTVYGARVVKYIKRKFGKSTEIGNLVDPA